MHYYIRSKTQNGKYALLMTDEFFEQLKTKSLLFGLMTFEIETSNGCLLSSIWGKGKIRGDYQKGNYKVCARYIPGSKNRWLITMWTVKG